VSNCNIGQGRKHSSLVLVGKTLHIFVSAQAEQFAAIDPTQEGG